MSRVILGGLGITTGVVVIIIVGLLVINGSLNATETCRDFSEGKISVNGKTFRVALADNEVERQQGLAGCSAIPQWRGMYFPYTELQEARYWMKGMLIPIDIVWVSQGSVIGIEENVPVIDESITLPPPIYRSPRPVDGVLEVGAGKAREYGINVGSIITYLPSD
ncbi:MAG: DUF192 domain-containing protein [Candidatus Andersenbacteria bacterium]